MAANKRTRTGCRTCRTRKLKCDEERPICGQCRKSNRECIPSEGITFRHAQNPGLNTASNDLENFYKYRQKYNANHFFLPVPRELKFVHVTDPYEDESLIGPSANYQQVAAHTLEALSTAATGDQPAMSQATYADYTGGYTQMGGKRSGHGQMRLDNQNNDINFLLNPSSTPSAMIDPNLEAVPGHHTTRDDGNRDGVAIEAGLNEEERKSGMISEQTRDEESIFENQILAALQNTAEAAVEHNVRHS